MKADKPNYIVRRLKGNWRVILQDGTSIPVTRHRSYLWYVNGAYRRTLRDAIVYAVYGL